MEPKLLDYRIGETLIDELSNNLYLTAYDCMREAVSNSLDARSPKLVILIPPETKDQIIIEDWGKGIDEPDTFADLGTNRKAIERETEGIEQIGEKGLGRLALRKLGETVEFLTNNNRVGFKIILNRSGKSMPYLYDRFDTFKPEQGVKIIISGLKVENIDQKFYTGKLREYLSEVYSLILTVGMERKNLVNSKKETIIPEIILNGEKLQPSLKHDYTIKYLFKLKDGSPVYGNLREDPKGDGTVDIFVHKVLVKNKLSVDRTRCFSGWILCDRLQPNTARDGIVENDFKREFMDKLFEYVQKFPKRSKSDMQPNKSVLNTLKDITSEMLAVADLFHDNKESKGRKDEKGVEGKLERNKRTKIIEEEEKKKEEHVPKQRNLNKKPTIKERKKKHGDLSFKALPCGEKEVVVFYDQNQKFWIINTDSSLYKLLCISTIRVGPEWFRITPHIADAIEEIDPKVEALDKREKRRYKEMLMSQIVNNHKNTIDGLEDFLPIMKD